MSTNTFIGLRQFLSHTGISDSILITLLDEGRLPCHLDAEGRIQVDVAKIPVERLGSELLQFEQGRSTPTQFGQEITESLESLLAEALALAFEWLEADSTMECSETEANDASSRK